MKSFSAALVNISSLFAMNPTAAPGLATASGGAGASGIVAATESCVSWAMIFEIIKYTLLLNFRKTLSKQQNKFYEWSLSSKLD